MIGNETDYIVWRADSRRQINNGARTDNIVHELSIYNS